MNAPASAKIGRNAPCPCGSGKKHKACCGKGGGQKAPPAPNAAALLANAYQAVARHDPAAAEHWFRQALALRPNHAEALAGLGQKLCWDHHVREGLGYLRQAAAQVEKEAAKTRDITSAIQLCEQLHHWGDLETALGLARLAARLAPDDPSARNSLALYLSRMNRAEEALPHARRACQLLPDNPVCNLLLGQLEARLGNLAEARERLERVAAGSSREHAARAWMELGAVLDQLKEYDQAFLACSRGTEAMGKLPKAQAMDAGQVFRSIAFNKAGFDRPLLNRWSREDYADGLPAPAFLIGFLRSGTTLAEQVLAAHPGIATSDENGILYGLGRELLRQGGGGEDVPAALRKATLEQARALRRTYWRRVEEEYGEAALRQRFIDKVALNSIDTGLISALFPEAKILFALRDPRDVCLSCFMQAFQPAAATVNLLSWQGIAKQYAAVMDLWLHLRDAIAPDYLELRYEDTVGDFENTFRRVFEFLGLEWTPEALAFHEKTQGRFIATPSFAAVSQPIFNTSVERWRRYAKHFPPVLPDLERFVQAFGYAASDAWPGQPRPSTGVL
jgi:Flp pilus assembly protein TadD